MTSRPAQLVSRWRHALSGVLARLKQRTRPLVAKLSPLTEWVKAIGQRLRPARQFIVRLSGPVTPVGWMALCTGVVMLVLALRFDWIEASTIALVCLLLFAIAVLWTLGKSNLEAQIEVDATRVRVGEHVLGRVTLTNRGRRGLVSSQIELPVGRGLAIFRVPPMATGNNHEEIFSVPTSRRAVIPIGPVRSVKSDPLQLLRRSQRWSDVLEVFVHPRTVWVDADATGLLRDVEGVTTRDLSSSDVSFHALRDYVPGDDRRAVHWRSTARTGRLIVRQFEETRKTHLLVALSLNQAEYPDAEDFETAVSAAGSLVLQAIREERAVTLMTQTGMVHAAAPAMLLDALCRLEPLAKCDRLPGLAAEAVRQVADATAAGLISGGAVAASELKLAHSHLPLDARTIAIRCSGSDKPGLRRIGDLRVLDIAVLADLPSAIRSVG